MVLYKSIHYFIYLSFILFFFHFKRLFQKSLAEIDEDKRILTQLFYEL